MRILAKWHDVPDLPAALLHASTLREMRISTLRIELFQLVQSKA